MPLISDLKGLSLEELLAEAWVIRRAGFPDVLYVAAPGAKHYENAFFANHPDRFIHASVTGTWCRLRCEHCRGKLLESMLPAATPGELLALARTYRARGASGILVSGGADDDGRVPLAGFFEVLRGIKELGMRVIVHTGLADERTARGLKVAGVDEVLLDVIGDEETARRVYHLPASPKDYLEAVRILMDNGLRTVPHVVAGLNFGRLAGEWQALEELSHIHPSGLVVVVLTPMSGTGMAGLEPPDPEEVGRLLAAARILNPRTPLALGCARPASPVKQRYETLALRAGVNTVAYPTESTIVQASEMGLTTVFTENCCSLALM